MPDSPSLPRELQILEQIENDPDTTQANLAEQLGVAVGTVNFAVKRLIKKGYIRVKQLERRRLKYIITPAGITLRAKLAMDSLGYSMRLYRETRSQARRLINEAQKRGYTAIGIEGDNELSEIARLTCLEMNVPIQITSQWPRIVVQGTTLELLWPALPDIGPLV